jgi:hypothetical protein
VYPALFGQINKLSAAKVPAFLHEHVQGGQTKSSPKSKKAAGANTTRYRHYKGGIYELVCEATQEADLQPAIVYRAPDGSLWIRPKSVFFEMITVAGKVVQRFTEIV